MRFIIQSKCNESCLTSVNSLYQYKELKKNTKNKHEYGELVSLLITFIIWCNELLSLIILNLFTDSLHFPSVFIHGLIQLFFNVINRIKIINQVWLGLIKKVVKIYEINQSKTLGTCSNSSQFVSCCSPYVQSLHI